MNIQGWFPLGLTGLISLQSKGVSNVFSSTNTFEDKVAEKTSLTENEQGCDKSFCLYLLRCSAFLYSFFHAAFCFWFLLSLGKTPLNTCLLLLLPHMLPLTYAHWLLNCHTCSPAQSPLRLHYPSLIRDREETCILSHSILTTSREGWVSAKLSRSCAASSLLPSLLSLPLPTASMVLIWWHLPLQQNNLSIGRDSSLFSSWENLGQESAEACGG